GIGVGRRAHVGGDHGETAGGGSREAARVDLPGGATVAEADHSGVPFVRVRQPDFDIDVRALGRVEDHLHDGVRYRRSVVLDKRDGGRVDLQRVEGGQALIIRLAVNGN